MSRAFVYETSRNSPKTSRIMRPVVTGLEKVGYHVELRESWNYPQGDEHTADLLAIWGDYHGTERIFADAPAPFIHIDNGYLRRGHYYGYYTVTYNAKQATGYLYQGNGVSSGRWLRLHETIMPWQKDGCKILVLGLSRKNCDNLKFPYPEWNKQLLSHVQETSEKPCIYREKEYKKGIIPLRNILKEDSWYACVGYNTKGLVEAVLEGIPIVTLGSAVSQWLSQTRLSGLHTRYFPPDREIFFSRLAWHQWTLEEIAQGKPWKPPSPLCRQMGI